jgi:hypothetical protein
VYQDHNAINPENAHLLQLASLVVEQLAEPAPSDLKAIREHLQSRTPVPMYPFLETSSSTMVCTDCGVILKDRESARKHKKNHQNQGCGTPEPPPETHGAVSTDGETYGHRDAMPVVTQSIPYTNKPSSASLYWKCDDTTPSASAAALIQAQRPLLEQLDKLLAGQRDAATADRCGFPALSAAGSESGTAAGSSGSDDDDDDEWERPAKKRRRRDGHGEKSYWWFSAATEADKLRVADVWCRALKDVEDAAIVSLGSTDVQDLNAHGKRVQLFKEPADKWLDSACATVVIVLGAPDTMEDLRRIFSAATHHAILVCAPTASLDAFTSPASGCRRQGLLGPGGYECQVSGQRCDLCDPATSLGQHGQGVGSEPATHVGQPASPSEDDAHPAAEPVRRPQGSDQSKATLPAIFELFKSLGRPSAQHGQADGAYYYCLLCHLKGGSPAPRDPPADCFHAASQCPRVQEQREVDEMVGAMVAHRKQVRLFAPLACCYTCWHPRTICNEAARRGCGGQCPDTMICKTLFAVLLLYFPREVGLALEQLRPVPDGSYDHVRFHPNAPFSGDKGLDKWLTLKVAAKDLGCELSNQYLVGLWALGRVMGIA